jgi:hypothetical protein
MTKGQKYGAIAVAFVVAVMVFQLSRLEPPKPEADPNQVTLTPQMEQTTRALIQAGGFQCERVGLIRRGGQTPQGGMLKAWCGPAGGTGLYGGFHFEVIPEALRVTSVRD